MRIKSGTNRLKFTRIDFLTKLKWLLPILLLFTSTLVYADQPCFRTSFSSENGRYELRYISGTSIKKLTTVQPPFSADTRTVEERYMTEKWSLLGKKAGKDLYTLEGDGLSKKTLLVSDNGDYVVAVDDFSERIPAKELSVLAFYNKGQLEKSYTIGDLLQNLENVHFSVSHFFVFGLFPKPARLPDFKLSVETNESIRYVFDVRTGEVLSKMKKESTTK